MPVHLSPSAMLFLAIWTRLRPFVWGFVAVLVLLALETARHERP